MPSGYDVFKMFAVDEGGGVTSLYFDRYQCSTAKSHIYKLTVSSAYDGALGRAA